MKLPKNRIVFLIILLFISLLSGIYSKDISELISNKIIELNPVIISFIALTIYVLICFYVIIKCSIRLYRNKEKTED